MKTIAYTYYVILPLGKWSAVLWTVKDQHDTWRSFRQSSLGMAPDPLITPSCHVYSPRLLPLRQSFIRGIVVLLLFITSSYLWQMISTCPAPVQDTSRPKSYFSAPFVLGPLISHRPSSYHALHEDSQTPLCCSNISKILVLGDLEYVHIHVMLVSFSVLSYVQGVHSTPPATLWTIYHCITYFDWWFCSDNDFNEIFKGKIIPMVLY